MVTAETDAVGTDQRLGLKRIGPCDWVIADLALPRSDARSIFATVRDDDDDVIVTWRRDVPLATSYLTAQAALEDAVRWLAHPPSGTRPIPIAHFPPAPLH